MTWRGNGQDLRQTTLSIALGELVDYDHPNPIPSLRYAYWKMGLSRCRRDTEWQSKIRDWIPFTSTRGQLVVVYYADRELAECPSFEEICFVQRFDCSQFVLIDTWQKGTKRLTDWVEIGRLKQWIEFARELGLKTSLAGSLRLSDVQAMQNLSPDVWAFRSAACVDGDRNKSLCSAKLHELKSWFDRHATMRPPPITTVRSKECS